MADGALHWRVQDAGVFEILRRRARCLFACIQLSSELSSLLMSHFHVSCLDSVRGLLCCVQQPGPAARVSRKTLWPTTCQHASFAPSVVRA